MEKAGFARVLKTELKSQSQSVGKICALLSQGWHSDRWNDRPPSCRPSSKLLSTRPAPDPLRVVQVLEDGFF